MARSLKYRDLSELYYVEEGTRLMAVAVSIEPGLTLGQPQKLFESTDLRNTPTSPSHDVSSDGQRFVTIAPIEGDRTEPPRIRIVQNWYEGFHDREQD